jgi:hypothetical protein
MPKVQLPPGNSGLQMEDGTHYKAGRPGGYVNVSDDHARAIDRMSGNGTAGLITAGFRVFGSSPRAGRWCTSCQPARLWNAWNDSCPRCGAATEPE